MTYVLLGDHNLKAKSKGQIKCLKTNSTSSARKQPTLEKVLPMALLRLKIMTKNKLKLRPWETLVAFSSH